MYFLNRIIKILFLLILLFFLGCDFRIPQAWETPEWEFDLNIPLINEEYSMASIASSSNDIQISLDSTDFMISINEPIIEPGTVVTDESFFIIEESDLELSFDNIINIPNPNPMPEFNFSETITIDNFIPDSLFGHCIPQNLSSSINETININIDSLCSDLNTIECLESINYLTIGSGNNTITIENAFPFKIDSIGLNINSGDNEFISTGLGNIDFLESDIVQFENEILECEIDAAIIFQINNQLQPTSNAIDNGQVCNWIEPLCTPYGGIWENDTCYIPITPLNAETCSEEFIPNAEWNTNNEECRLMNDLPELACTNPLIWDSDLEQCYIVYELNSSSQCEQIGLTWLENEENDEYDCCFACNEQQQCCEDAYQGLWSNDECNYSSAGIEIVGNESLTVSNNITINNFESLNALIRDCDIPATYSVPLTSNPNMNLIEGHISSVNHPDTNRIIIDLTNNLFTNIYADINSPNLIDSLGNPLIVEINSIAVGESFDDIVLSDYIIKNLDGSPIDNLEMTFQINIPDQVTTIDFDTPYGLSGSGVNIKTTKLEALKVNLNEFSSPDINMGSVPSGLDGFDLPYLSFNINLHNQISADMKLYLDLYGIDDEDTLKIHVEPDIKFLDLLSPEVDTDSLTISFYQDTMSVWHTGNELSHTPPVKTLMDHKIAELFAYDIIDLSGYAVMNGDATLLPNKSLWGDIDILIHPLTIVIENPQAFGFVADQFTQLTVMDPTMATKIDSGLISATIDMNLENKIPFSGNLLMYISNNPDYFPFFIDSLITGSLDEQEVSDSCKTYITNYLGCQNFSVDAASNFVKHLDCITTNDDTYYYENLLNIEFLPPTLDNWGNVLDSILTQQEIILHDEVYYFTKDNLQYLIPRFVFNSELDTITLQPNNSLKINSSIMFRLLSTGLLE